MDSIFKIFALVFICFGCARQPTLPPDSKFNATSLRNDTVWYGTAKGLRLHSETQDPDQVKRFDLRIVTDIDYPGNHGFPNPKTHTGCLNGDCIQTQALSIYNIPLKRGKAKIAKLDKGKKSYIERTSLVYIGNSGGLVKCYIQETRKPGWIRVTKYDKNTGMVEGNFALTLDEDKNVYGRLINGMPEIARFNNGMFRVKVTDVKAK